MASITRETVVDAPAEEVWEALRDFGAVDRLARGFVTACRLEDPQTRVVTFASGATATERLVAVDDERRRLVYSNVDSPLGLTHDNSSARVHVDADGRTRFEWTKDLLPDAAAPVVADLMDHGLEAIRRSLEAGAAVTAGTPSPDAP